MTSLMWILMILVLVISMIVSGTLRSKFEKYSKLLLSSGLTGKDVAEKMLKENGIYDVKVVSVGGYLSDHYNPLTKTVNLSPDVYNGRSIASAAVAAHECGHALQHADAYSWLMLRSRLVPVVQFSSGLVQWIIIAGIVLINVFPQILLAGIILFALTTIFSIITLPVEFDASNRALAWLQRTNVTGPGEFPKAQDALKWAAMTYVIAAISSVVTLVYYILLFVSGSRSRD
jgi:Zn-dependent membrane protease YugP